MGMPSAQMREERLSSGARALLGLLRPAAAVDALPPRAWGDIVDLALRHGVGPLLHRALQARGELAQLPGDAIKRLEDERRATALDNLRNYGEFRRIARALRERGIPVIALKGLHLAELVYRDISLRPMSDLDILVPEAQVKPAVDLLLASEYELDRRYARGYDAGLTHRRLGIMVEVHWTLAEPTERYTPPIEDIWRSAPQATVGDAKTQVMSPEFLMLHVCAHLAYQHVFAFDLRALCDIAEIVRAHPVLDWAAVADHGRRHGWTRGIAAALRLARDHLGAAVPEDALVAVGGDGLAADALADALEQLVTGVGISNALRNAPNLVALKSPIGWRQKVAMFWNRLFVSRAELARIYRVSEGSARIGLFYAVRLRDLLRRYAANLREMNAHGAHLAESTARQALLARWIDKA